ncbi:MAG: class I SAM-dependent methyltransferase [Pseudomonadales bacterium]
MIRSEVENLPNPSELDSSTGIDWDAYASQYDLLAKYNPSYHENVEMLRKGVLEWSIPDDARICDLGAGTGNYITALSKVRPMAKYVHVDFDRPMNEIAREKYVANGISDVVIVEENIHKVDFTPQTFDLVVCVNALYAVSPQADVLAKVRKWLKPSGVFFVIDFGRRNRMWDWSWYILKNLVKEHGFIECAKFLSNSAEMIRQNNRGQKNQADGKYWLHSTHEFGKAMTEAGFLVEELRPCYRDYCDLAVCRKAPTPP